MAWHDVVGTFGVAFIVLAYWLVQSERLTSTDRRWSAINLIGSGLVLVSLSVEFNWSAFLVEFFWVGLSIYGLVKRRPA